MRATKLPSKNPFGTCGRNRGWYRDGKETIDWFFDTTGSQCTRAGDTLFFAHEKLPWWKWAIPSFWSCCWSIFAELFKEIWGHFFEKLRVDVNNGFWRFGFKTSRTFRRKIRNRKGHTSIMEQRSWLGHGETNKGITNLHVPSDVIIDASMPAMIRNSGQMWDKDGKTRDTLAVIPDSSYAGVYQATIDFCKKNGAFNPAHNGDGPQ